MLCPRQSHRDAVSIWESEPSLFDQMGVAGISGHAEHRLTGTLAHRELEELLILKFSTHEWIPLPQGITMEGWVDLRSANREREMLRITMPPARVDIK